MNRRGFLKLFAGAAAGAIVVPKVSYFFAPRGGWVTNGYYAEFRQGVSLADIEKALADVWVNYGISPSRIFVSKELAQELKSRFLPSAYGSAQGTMNIMGVDVQPSPFLSGSQIMPEVPLKWRGYFPVGFPTTQQLPERLRHRPLISGV